MPSAQENFKLLALVIKDLKAEGALGKINYDNITKELGLPSVGAAKYVTLFIFATHFQSLLPSLIAEL